MKWFIASYCVFIFFSTGIEVPFYNVGVKEDVQEVYNPMPRLKKMVGIPDSANFQDHRYCTIGWEKRVKFVLDSLQKNIDKRRKIKRDLLNLKSKDPI